MSLARSPTPPQYFYLSMPSSGTPLGQPYSRCGSAVLLTSGGKLATPIREVTSSNQTSNVEVNQQEKVSDQRQLSSWREVQCCRWRTKHRLCNTRSRRTRCSGDVSGPCGFDIGFPGKLTCEGLALSWARPQPPLTRALLSKLANFQNPLSNYAIFRKPFR